MTAPLLIGWVILSLPVTVLFLALCAASARDDE